MKFGILGPRGISNNYRGFEQFAERHSVGLVERLLQNGHLEQLKREGLDISYLCRK